MEIEEVKCLDSLPLLSLNHVSILCRSVWNSVRFYEDVLGFCLIKRPVSFNFNGAWWVFLALFLIGVVRRIHILRTEIQNFDYPSIFWLISDKKTFLFSKEKNMRNVILDQIMFFKQNFLHFEGKHWFQSSFQHIIPCF